MVGRTPTSAVDPLVGLLTMANTRLFEWGPRSAPPFAQQAKLTKAKPVALTELTAPVSENRVTAAAISPDGAASAFAALGDAIFLRRMSDGFSRQVNTPDGVRVNRIEWFPDASRLLMSGSMVGEPWAAPMPPSG
jgi:hypothetical protein